MPPRPSHGASKCRVDGATCAASEIRKRKRDADAFFAEFCEASVPASHDATGRVDMRDVATLTDRVPLQPYLNALDLVPKTVNVVTLCEAHPDPLSPTPTKLPLDMTHIVRKLSVAYFAPRSFAAVQIAFSNPRSRVLLFHTGNVVGTGTDSIEAARLAITRVQRILADEAGVFLELRSFRVINIVAASALGARVDCERFASDHTENSHFDRNSFVGMPWRPQGAASW